MKTTSDHWFFRPIGWELHSEFNFPTRVASRLTRMATAAYPYETGGLVLGWWEGKTPRIYSIIEVEDPNAGLSSWHRNEKASSAALAKALNNSCNPHVGYIGDWHSHPADVGPSRQDIGELRRISLQYSKSIVLLVVRENGSIDTRLARRGFLVDHTLTGYSK